MFQGDEDKVIRLLKKASTEYKFRRSADSRAIKHLCKGLDRGKSEKHKLNLLVDIYEDGFMKLAAYDIKEVRDILDDIMLEVNDLKECYKEIEGAEMSTIDEMRAEIQRLKEQLDVRPCPECNGDGGEYERFSFNGVEVEYCECYFCDDLLELPRVEIEKRKFSHELKMLEYERPMFEEVTAEMEAEIKQLKEHTDYLDESLAESVKENNEQKERIEYLEDILKRLGKENKDIKANLKEFCKWIVSRLLDMDRMLLQKQWEFAREISDEIFERLENRGME